MKVKRSFLSYQVKENVFSAHNQIDYKKHARDTSSNYILKYNFTSFCLKSAFNFLGEHMVFFYLRIFHSVFLPRG